jgi:hypothetical protein
MLPTERSQLLGILCGRWIGEVAFDFGGACYGVRETVAEAQADFPAYFWRKRSTRPAVSTSFCFPVKNGWQLEQISRWSSPTVERVCQVLPQAHFTFVVAYSGWMSAFTAASEGAGKELRNVVERGRRIQVEQRTGLVIQATDWPCSSGKRTAAVGTGRIAGCRTSPDFAPTH